MTQIKTAADFLNDRLATQESIMMAAMAHLINRHNLHHELGLEIVAIAKDRNVDDEMFRELTGPAIPNEK